MGSEAKPRVLTVDIERLPGIAGGLWEPKTRYVPISQWLRMPSLLCVGAKWHGEKRVRFYSRWQDGTAGMLGEIWRLYNDADLVVTYNGIRFDNKHLRSEWVTHGFGVPSPWLDVDLFQANKRLFGFESKSLQHLCDRLGIDGKAGHYDADQAEAALAGDPKAQRYMRRYQVQDVRITEHVYDVLAPWISGHPNVVLYSDDAGRRACPNCGSDSLQSRGRFYTKASAFPRFRCNDCGTWSRGRKADAISELRSV